MRREAEEAVAYVLHTARSWAQLRASPPDRPQSEQIWCSQVMGWRPRDLRQFGKGGTPSRTSHATRRTALAGTLSGIRATWPNNLIWILLIATAHSQSSLRGRGTVFQSVLTATSLTTSGREQTELLSDSKGVLFYGIFLFLGVFLLSRSYPQYCCRQLIYSELRIGTSCDRYHHYHHWIFRVT